MDQEDHPNLRVNVHPDEPDHSQPSSQRTLLAKQEREAGGGAAVNPERKGSM
jgi:hypothetical protein